MIIVGAKGFAKEILEIVHDLSELKNLVFYDDVNEFIPNILFSQFPMLKTLEEAENYIKTIDARFTLGIGNPILRKKLFETFISIGGIYNSTISPHARIGSYNVSIDKGCNILSGAVLSNETIIGKGCIIYYNSVITHDCKVGDFVEIAPSVTILGRCIIGDFTQIGASATILPDVNIGNNVIIAAGSVVTKDVPNNCMVAGVPAIIKSNFN